MSIQIPQPSMALNAEGLPPYSMWNSWAIDDGKKATAREIITVENIIDNVAAVADSAPDHYLRVVIFNAHGSGAWIHLGAGIRALTPSFAKWRGRVANIWSCSCRLVDPKTPMYQQPAKPPDYNDGNMFCSGLAKLTGAYVVASSSPQDIPFLPIPWGHINDWEGRVLRYEPDHGSVDWTHDYGRGLIGTTPPPIAIPPRFRAFTGGAGPLWKEPREKPWWQWHPSQIRRRGSGVAR